MTQPEEAEGPTVSIRIPAHPQFGKAVRDTVIAFARRCSVTQPELEEFVFAVGEATANAIEHSRFSDFIEIRCHVRHDTILATVCDSGAGFETAWLGNAALPDGLAERGRGLPIMRHCTDIFAVHSEPGKGTAVVLGRYLRPAPDRHERGVLAS